MNQACLYKNPNFVTSMQGGGYDPDMGVMVNHIANASTPQAKAMLRSAQAALSENTYHLNE